MNAKYPSAPWRLRLLGSPTLEGADGALGGRPVQRHRLALLALLALAPDGRVSRDKLIAMLWPESSTDRGRNLLKVSTYELRKVLGEGALLSVGEDLRLDPAVVGSDAGDFDAARAAADHATAVELYRGPLLDGFFLRESPEFEQWVDRERDRLAGGFLNTLEALAAEAEDAQDLLAAVRWWKVRAAQDPYDSRVALRLVQALEASGNRAGALQHAALHQRLIQEEFELEPAPALAALAERLRTAPPPSPLQPARPAPVPPSDPEPAGAPGDAAGRATVAPRRPGRLPLVAGFAAVLIAAAAVWVVWPRGTERDRSIVVLPFANLTREADGEYFGDGLTDEIITRLSAVPGLKVISRTSAMHYRGSEKPLGQIAEELDVANVLEGSIRRSSGRVRITAQLVDARADRQLWARTWEDTLQDVFGVQEQIAREVLRGLEVKLGASQQSRLAARGTRDPQAYELYRRGRFFWSRRTRQDHEQAMAYYRRAIRRDSSYADPYAGLADAYLTAYQLGYSSVPEAEVYSRIKWAAEEAMALDEASADAHTSLAIGLWWQRNWPGAERELRRAIELNPGHATARSWYALLLVGMGRLDDAVRESRVAAELDPFAVITSITYAWTCYVARAYSCAVEQFRSTIEINPAWAPAHAQLGVMYALMGRHAAALEAVTRARALRPGNPSYLADLAYVHALARRNTEAAKLLAQVGAAPPDGFNVARAYAALGMDDSAFAWLKRSRWEWPHRAVRYDPALDPLRDDPRFKQLSDSIDREMGVRF